MSANDDFSKEMSEYENISNRLAEQIQSLKKEPADISDHGKNSAAQLSESLDAAKRVTEIRTSPIPIANDELILKVKGLRKGLDEQLQILKQLPPTREASLSITNLQQSIMWLGMVLKEIGTPNPYPKSYDPTSTRIEPTADGLKL